MKRALLAALAQLSEEQAAHAHDALAQALEQLDDAIADDDDPPPPSRSEARAALALLVAAGDAARAALAEPVVELKTSGAPAGNDLQARFYRGEFVPKMRVVGDPEVVLPRAEPVRCSACGSYATEPAKDVPAMSCRACGAVFRKLERGS